MPTIRITVEQHGQHTLVQREFLPDLKALDLIAQVLQELKLPHAPTEWSLWLGSRELKLDGLLKDLFQGVPLKDYSLTLRLRVPIETDSSDFDILLDDSDLDVVEESGSQIVALDEEWSETMAYEVDIDDVDARIPLAPAAPSSSPKPAASAAAARDSESERKLRRRQGRRRATARYYSRMNPSRVYPLLVFLTEEMVQQVRQQGARQTATGPFQVDLDQVVEVEPILPGCDCFPPKATARLDRKNLKLTFHVVPHVLGKIEGAKLLIRQDHRTIAKLRLEAKVSQRVVVVICGVCTFLLPFATSILRHLGLDSALGAQMESGFSLYLLIAQTIIERIPPVLLTAFLAGVTGALWWFTRPRREDAFFEFTLESPEQALRKIEELCESDPDKGADELAAFLDNCPDHQPAWVFFANWHYTLKNHTQALHGYKKAFRLGPATWTDYHQAALCASQLKKNELALDIIKRGAAALPSKKVPGIVWFNRACYHCRLGQLDSALPCLRNAVKAGFRKSASFQTDPDLAPVRDMPEFKLLLQELQRA